MSQFYDEMADLALEMIRKFGQEIVVIREGPFAQDPISGTVIIEEEQRMVLQAIVIPTRGTLVTFDNHTMGQDSLIDEKQRFVKAAAKGATFEPQSGDVVEMQGKRWRIIGATPVAPAGIPLLYNFRVQLV